MSVTSKESFEPLLDEDEQDDIESAPQISPPRKTTLRWLRPILCTLLLVSLIFAIIIAASALQPLHTTPSSPQSPVPSLQTQQAPWSSCGHSPATARERGCSFDMISFTWQTRECFDASLSEEFLNWDTWEWYMDEFANETIAQDVAMRGEQDTWVSWHYHVVHCTFMWIQMHRAFEKGWIGHHLHVYEHTLHCQHTLLMDGNGHDGHEGYEERTPAVVLYPRCERVGSAPGMYPGAQFGS